MHEQLPSDFLLIAASARRSMTGILAADLAISPNKIYSVDHEYARNGTRRPESDAHDPIQVVMEKMYEATDYLLAVESAGDDWQKIIELSQVETPLAPMIFCHLARGLDQSGEVVQFLENALSKVVILTSDVVFGYRPYGSDEVVYQEKAARIWGSNNPWRDETGQIIPAARPLANKIRTAYHGAAEAVWKVGFASWSRQAGIQTAEPLTVTADLPHISPEELDAEINFNVNPGIPLLEMLVGRGIQPQVRNQAGEVLNYTPDQVRRLVVDKVPADSAATQSLILRALSHSSQRAA